MKYLVLWMAAAFLFSTAISGRPAQAQELGQGSTFYDIIKNDHKVISADFDKVKAAADNDAKKKAFNTLKQDLFAHMRAEESYWYPVLQNNQQSNGIAIQAKDEHMAARTELEKISANWKTEPPRLELAQKLVNDHVSFEEGTMFGQSRQVIQADEEKKITDQFRNAESP